MSKPSILVTGSKGFIGKRILEKLHLQQFKVIESTRNFDEAKRERKVFINSQEIENFSKKNIDFIINAIGYYSTSSDQNEITKMVNANINSAIALSNFVSEFKTPLVHLASYFEKCPQDVQPWSFYALTKITGRMILTNTVKTNKLSQINLYLYDNFGYKENRGKIFEILLNAALEKKIVESTLGEQEIDLLHIDDVVDGILQCIDILKNSKNNTLDFQIRSGNSLNLKDLVSLIESNLNLKINVDWGKLPYRDKEVFKMWDSARDLPGFKPKKDIAAYLKNLNPFYNLK